MIKPSTSSRKQTYTTRSKYTHDGWVVLIRSGLLLDGCSFELSGSIDPPKWWGRTTLHGGSGLISIPPAHWGLAKSENHNLF